MNNKQFIQKLIKHRVLKDENTLYIKYKKILQSDIYILNEIVTNTAFLQYDADLKARIHCILKNITEQPVCSGCGKVLKMRMDGRYRYTFSNTCGSKCFSGNEEVKNKRKATNQKKYGSTNYLTSTIGTNARLTTLQDKYGVDNAGKIESGKVKRKQTIVDKYGSKKEFDDVCTEQRKKTMLEVYGVDHPMHSKSIKQKQQDTILERYGVKNVWFDSDVQERRFKTMLDKYGVEYALQNAECRQKHLNSMVDNHNVPHALQSKTIQQAKSQTMLSRYGVENSHHLNISPESLSKLQDKDWLIDQHHNLHHTITEVNLL